jgi:hypothetical protein
MRNQGKGCLRGIDVKERDPISFVQFSVCRYNLGGLRGVIDDDDLQFSSEDSFSLIDPSRRIQHPLGAFPA